MRQWESVSDRRLKAIIADTEPCIPCGEISEVYRLARELAAFRILCTELDVAMDGVECPVEVRPILMGIRRLVERIEP